MRHEAPMTSLAAATRALQAGDAAAALALLGEDQDDNASWTEEAPEPAMPAGWHALRGMALLAREEWLDAQDSLLAAIAQGDRTPATALNLALAGARLDGQALARRTISQLEREHPHWDEPPFRLAELLRSEGRTDEAAAAYERALAVAPGRTESLLRLATLHIGCGAPRQAESLLVRCCGVDPDNWEAWDALGVTSCLLQDLPAARAAFRRALALHPASLPIALRLVGTACLLGQVEAELDRFEAMSLADPLQANFLAGRASLLFELGRDEEALQLLEAAVAIDPGSAGLAGLRAERLLRTSDYKPALEALLHALALDPGNLALRNNLAVAMARLHRYAEALQILDELAALGSERVDMLCNRANTLVCLGRQADGVATARRATQLADAAAEPPQGGLRHMAWRTLANALAYSEAASGATLGPVLRVVADTAPRHPDDAAAFPPRTSDEDVPEPRRKLPRRKLRVGLFSATLRTHPVGWLTLAGFENLDPEPFQIVCIAQREGSDAMQRRFRAVAAEWHPLAEARTPDFADRVRGLDLDILIDLGGYGDLGMLGVCARRLAPVQIKWVGMQNHTTAMPEIDRFVTDRWETPPHLAPLYSERLLSLPDGYVCYAPPVYAPDVATLPALRHGAVTFGCFNNLAKITPTVIATWAAILHDLPGARLVLKAHQFSDTATAAFVHAGFAAHGIAPDRVELRGGSGHRTVLAEYGDIDIVLDPFPYSGGLTTCEALWMGVPVLTWPGEIFASRHSASHLCNIGLDDWVVPDLAAYRREAVRRACDLPALSALRAGLRPTMRQSPLCDGPRFGRHLGEALLRAWRERRFDRPETTP